MMMRLILGALALGGMTAPAGAKPAQGYVGTPGCRPIGGLEMLWGKPSLRWIIVGEQHGTWEMPAAFRDIVCNAAAAKRPIVVALERPESEQADIDAFLTSAGGPDPRAALLRNPMWQNKSLQDGRSSRAYLHLIDQMRVMHHGGAVQKVIAFQPSRRPLDPASYEAQMASLLKSAAASKNALILAFVGNCHAMRFAMCGNKPAAAYLPPAETFTINVEGTGGSVWNCGGSCGVHRVGGASPRGTPRLQMLNDPKQPWDAMLFLGGPVTASPPAVAQVEAAHGS